MADTKSRAGSSLLVDARLSNARRSSEDFRTRAKWVASLGSKGLSSRCAIVVSPESHQFALPEWQLRTMRFSLEMSIFTDLEEVRAGQ
jgi:hypothetical protein